MGNIHVKLLEFGPVVQEMSFKEQEMSQTRDECPQRNWSSIRHI